MFGFDVWGFRSEKWVSKILFEEVKMEEKVLEKLGRVEVPIRGISTHHNEWIVRDISLI